MRLRKYGDHSRGTVDYRKIAFVRVYNERGKLRQDAYPREDENARV